MSDDLRRLLGAVLAAERGEDALVDELVAPLLRTVAPGRTALDEVVDALAARHAAGSGAFDTALAHVLVPGSRDRHPVDHDHVLAARPSSDLLRALAWLPVDPVRSAELALRTLDVPPDDPLALGQSNLVAADALRRAGLTAAAVRHADTACTVFLDHRDHDASVLGRAVSAARLSAAFDLRVDIARQQDDHLGAMAWIRRARLADTTSPTVAASGAAAQLGTAVDHQAGQAPASPTLPWWGARRIGDTLVWAVAPPPGADTTALGPLVGEVSWRQLAPTVDLVSALAPIDRNDSGGAAAQVDRNDLWGGPAGDLLVELGARLVPRSAAELAHRHGALAVCLPAGLRHVPLAALGAPLAPGAANGAPAAAAATRLGDLAAVVHDPGGAGPLDLGRLAGRPRPRVAVITGTDRRFPADVADLGERLGATALTARDGPGAATQLAELRPDLLVVVAHSTVGGLYQRRLRLADYVDQGLDLGDGDRITGGELAALPLGGVGVVLAACTGAGTVLDGGDEWLGAARRLRDAGADWVLTATWPLEVHGFSALVGPMVAALRSGHSPTFALQASFAQARAATWERHLLASRLAYAAASLVVIAGRVTGAPVAGS